MYGIGNALISRDTSPNTGHNTLVYRGHKGARDFINNGGYRQLFVLCFSSKMKIATYFVPHAKLQALYLSYVQKKATKSRCRSQEREKKMVSFTNLIELSYPAVWLGNTVLNDVPQLKRCLCKTSTKYLTASRVSIDVGVSYISGGRQGFVLSLN